jgi:DNA excision repair protein ERCC-3
MDPGVDALSAYRPDLPLVVQSDHTLLLEVDNPHFPAARDDLVGFAELIKSPEHVHTYRLTPLSLWNAAAAGWTPERVLAALRRWSKFELPDGVVATVRDRMARYGRLRLVAADGGLCLEADDPLLIAEIARLRGLQPYLAGADGPRRLRLAPLARGFAKQALIKAGHPVEDRAGYVAGAPLAVALRSVTPDGEAFALRPYQSEAVAAFWAGGGSRGGNGVIVLPCGAGKTLVAIAALCQAATQTLILCANNTSVRQWQQELLRRTTLSEAEVGQYTGLAKEIAPVTITTYQMLTAGGRKGSGEFPHMRLFQARPWGLVIYDEVHLLPAPVFRVTAEIQATRRLGLTATLVREDGHEDDVFALIGPKRFDLPWRVLEAQGWIATATCHELRVDLPEDLRVAYATVDGAARFRVAAENPRKEELAAQLVAQHAGERILVIGQYLEQLQRLAGRLGAPLLTGRTPQRERDRLFDAFRRGEEPVLVVSRVANFAVDLPDASVAIEVSGLFGSRQEEAQRLGRLLRPKADGRPATFYALVSRETVEEDFALRRQLFLTEQGYRYTVRRAVAMTATEAAAGVAGQ